MQGLGGTVEDSCAAMAQDRRSYDSDLAGCLAGGRGSTGTPLVSLPTTWASRHRRRLSGQRQVTTLYPSVMACGLVANLRFHISVRKSAASSVERHVMTSRGPARVRALPAAP